MEALSAGVGAGLHGRAEPPHKARRRRNVSLRSFKRTFPSRFISGAGCQEGTSATALHNPDSISEERRPQIEGRAANWRRQG